MAERVMMKEAFLDDYLEKLIEATFNGEKTYCKFLSANDTKKTKGHQNGILITKNAESILHQDRMSLVPNRDGKPNIYERFVSVTFFKRDKDEPEKRNKVRFVYYDSKNEFRITRIPRIDEDSAGSLFVLIQQNFDEYQAYFLDSERDCKEFLNVFGYSPLETNAVINEGELPTEELDFIKKYIASLNNEGTVFPEAENIAEKAREMYDKTRNEKDKKVTVDNMLVGWLRSEYNIFKSIEDDRYREYVQKPFYEVRKFIHVANSVLNRRKSRAGKSLELHLYKLFKKKELEVDPQAVTEKKHKPDFLFPSKSAYVQASKEASAQKIKAAIAAKKYGIVVLAAKTTCKDRWRQILEEADLLDGGKRYLFTLQPCISTNQLEQMKSRNVILVVPQSIKKYYPTEYRKDILSLNAFINMVKKIQKNAKKAGTAD